MLNFDFLVKGLSKNRKKKLFHCYFHESFVENFMKKPSFFNIYFQNSFQDVVLCRLLKSQNFCQQNDGSIIITQNVKRNRVLLLSSRCFCQKLHEKTAYFQYKFLKFISRCTILP